MTGSDQHRNSFFAARNGATRIDVFDELSHTALAALRTFFRKIGAPHLLDEVILPIQEDGDASIFVAVRDRPWPPWGVGARTISAVCQVQMIADESFAISPIYLGDEDLTNIGLQAALFKEVLDSLTVSPRAELNYLIADGATWTPHVLHQVGFRRAEDVFLTEEARYYTWRAPVEKLLDSLGLADATTPDLLANDMPDEVLSRNAMLHHSIYLGSRAEWTGVSRLAESLRLPRGGHAGKPGGVPGGTGRFGYPFVTEDPRFRTQFFVTLENFLGERRKDLLKFALAHEKEFVPSSVVHNGQAVVDQRERRNRTLYDLGEFAPLFVEKVKEALAPIARELDIREFALGDIELQLAASGDGDYFHMHRDGDDTSSREISFVYFFHGDERRFSGGELRLFDTEEIDGKPQPTDRSQILSPRQDLIVFFQSRDEHELLPVRVPTKSFADSRFTVNGWLHRAKA